MAKAWEDRAPEPRIEPVRSRNLDLDVDMFDGTARRRRIGLAIALFALAVVAATVIAAVASHYRPM